MKKQSEVKTVLVDDDYYPRLMKSGLGEKKARRRFLGHTVRFEGGGGTIPYVADYALKIR